VTASSTGESGANPTFGNKSADVADLIDPVLKPAKLDISATVRWLGYKPTYSVASLLSELAAYGDIGPPQLAQA